jgi:hypothetical protein
VKADPPGDSVPRDPGLDQLLAMLTASPTPDELTGEDAALAMFLANQRPAPEMRSLRSPRVYARRAARLAAAVTIAMAGAFAGAAYAAALPAPVQHAAYRVLGFAGVPDIPRGRPPAGQPHLSSTAPASSSPTPHPRRSTGHVQPRTPSPTPRPSASSSAAAPGPGSLTMTAQHGQIVAGTSETFAGQLTERGRPVRGAKVRLLERVVGRPGWHVVAHGATGAAGRVVLVVDNLTANAAFQVTGPDATLSRPVFVIVLPPVTARLTGSSHRRYSVLTAVSPLAHAGDAEVLQIRLRGTWLSVRVHRLNGGGKAVFLIRPRPRARVYRVVLLATVEHGRSASLPVTVPAR